MWWICCYVHENGFLRSWLNTLSAYIFSFFNKCWWHNYFVLQKNQPLSSYHEIKFSWTYQQAIWIQNNKKDERIFLVKYEMCRIDNKKIMTKKMLNSYQFGKRVPNQIDWFKRCMFHIKFGIVLVFSIHFHSIHTENTIRWNWRW